MDLYCAHCGQADKQVLLPFKDLIVDFLAANFNFDTKLGNTLKNMLLKPGKITVEFLQGRREQFVQPLKFYFFCSFLFYMVNTLTSYLDEGTKENDFNISFNNNENTISFNDSKDTLHFMGIKIDGEDTNKKLQWISHHASIQQIDSISGRKNNTFQIYLIRRMASNFMKDKKLLSDQIINNVKTSLILLMPGFALLLWLFYLRQHRFFIEHLLFSVHLHSALLLLMCLMQLFSLLWEGFMIIGVLMSVFYLYKSLLVFYAQSTLKTKFKTLFLLISHGFLLLFVVLIAGLWSVMIL